MLSFFVAEDIESNNLISGNKYITSEDGILKIYVNVWGEVNIPGRVLVDEGVDLPTVLSFCGGPLQSANLKKIKIYRKETNSNVKILTIDLEEYLESGPENNIVIKPNDTIVVSQKVSSFILKQISVLNTFMGMLNLYLNIQNTISE